MDTFAPSDAEHLVHFKFWSPNLPTETLDVMAAEVLDAYHWDFKEFSNRWVQSPISDGCIAAHQGEWLSIATAAYAATREKLPGRATELLELLQFELTRQAKVFLEFKRSQAGVGMLKAAALVSHHLIDLDRMITSLGLEETDPLYLFAFQAGKESKSRSARFSGAFLEVTRLSQSVMASENQRHIALRALRSLTKSKAFLLPIAPFFDDWGKVVGSHPDLTPQEIGEIVEVLYLAWETLKGPDGVPTNYAYPRAVSGILNGFTGGLSKLSPWISPSVEKKLSSGLFHSLYLIPQSRFEEQWEHQALR